MNNISDSDIELMLQFQNGDNNGFDRLLEKYQKPIINIIYRMIGDRFMAEDLAQEVFLKVYESRNSYKPKAKFFTWIYKIATNISLNHLRYQRRHRTESLDITLEVEDEAVSKQIADTSMCSPSENLQKKELQGKIKEAIKSLPEKQKLVVTLAKFQGLSHKEIAEILGSSVMAVKLHLYRARIALKNKLSDYVNQT